MFKKLTSFILITVLLLTLISCAADYPPVESTEREKTVVMTMAVGEKNYEIKYELYRALLLTLKDDYMGDDGVLDAEETNALSLAINARLADIFSVLALAEEIGIDVWSKEYNKLVEDCVNAGVNGGTVGAFDYEGFGGDYDKYLASLKEMNLNYSVQDLMLRYALALDDIYYYYRGNVDNDAELGHIEYTRGDVLDFYNSPDTARVMQLYLSTASTSHTIESAERIRDKIANVKTDDEVFTIMMSNTLIGDAGNELSNGRIIAKYNLDSFYYSALTDAAQSLSTFEASEVIEVTTNIDHGFFIIYKIEKNDEHFEECYESIRDAYIENEIGKLFAEKIDMLKNSAKISDGFTLIDFNTISMDN